MKFKVTLPSSVLCDTLEDAMTLVAKAGPGTVIEVVDENAPVRRARQPKPVAEGEATPKRRGRSPKATAESEATPKRRGRPPKVKTEEAQAEEAPAEAQAEEAPTEETPAISRKAVMDEFSKLVDQNYETAIAVLEKFRVQRFSDLPDEALPAFYEELKAAA